MSSYSSKTHLVFHGLKVSLVTFVIVGMLLPVYTSRADDPTFAPEVDFADVALLVDSTLEEPNVFDTFICDLAEFYGARCKIIDILEDNVTIEDLQDDKGDIFPLIVISADAMPLLSGAEVNTLRIAARDYETNFLIGKLRPWSSQSQLTYLTDGNIIDIERPRDSNREWTVSEDLPEITQEFTGLNIFPNASYVPVDNEIVVRRLSSVVAYPIITATDDEGEIYPTVVMLPREKGRIFVEAGESIPDLPLHDLYYLPEQFPSVVPLMIIMHYALGDEAWHSPENYANLTLDSAALEEQFRLLNYRALLTEMNEHDFHTTIAMPPFMASESDTAVASLFLQNPMRYSLAQYGNDTDGYEFYYYEIPDEIRTADTTFRARPFYEQFNDIQEGLGRLSTHQVNTGIPFGRVMIFPIGISPLPTLQLLKQYGYLGTVGQQDIPLGEEEPDDWAFGMAPSIMELGSFPIIHRDIYVRTYEDDRYESYVQTAIYDLFLDKPALFWSYPYQGELFTTGLQEFSPIADAVNDLCCDEIQWRSLENIFQHLRLQKTNDDGSVSVRMYANQLFLTNEGDDEQTYYIVKTEDLSVPIRSVTVGDDAVDYQVKDGDLQMTLDLVPGETAKIKVNYANIE